MDNTPRPRPADEILASGEPEDVRILARSHPCLFHYQRSCGRRGFVGECVVTPPGAAPASSSELRRALAAAITRAIRESGMSQVEAARLAQVTAPRMSDLVRGKIEKVSLDALVAIAAPFGVQLVVVTQDERRPAPTSTSLDYQRAEFR